MSHFNIDAKYPVIFALILLGLTNLWFYSTEVPDLDFTPKTPIAFVSAQNSAALIQQPGQKYWQNTVVGQALFSGEKIQTQQEPLTLTLASGASLSFSPNSLFELNSFQNDTDLRIHQGQLKLKSAQSQRVKLSLNTQSYILFNLGEIDLYATQGQFQIQVHSGSLIAKSSGDRRLLQAGQKARLTSHQIFFEENDLKLADTFNPENYLLTPQSQFEFRLQSYGQEYDQVHFQYGPNPDELRGQNFKRQARTEHYQAQVPPGLWFWKVTASSSIHKSKKIETGLYKTHFQKLGAPIALSPHRIFYKQGPFNETEIKFHFQNPANYKNLVLEISPDPNFYTEVQRVDVGLRTSETIKVGSHGNMFWRVVGSINDNEHIVESQTKQFAILEHIPQDLSWAKHLGYNIDWEVSLEAKKNSVRNLELSSGYFIYDLNKVPSDTVNPRFRFLKAGTDFMRTPWRPKVEPDLKIPVNESGFYHFQIIADDATSEKTRLVRSDLLFLSVFDRKPASN